MSVCRDGLGSVSVGRRVRPMASWARGGGRGSTAIAHSRGSRGASPSQGRAPFHGASLDNKGGTGRLQTGLASLGELPSLGAPDVAEGGVGVMRRSVGDS